MRFLSRQLRCTQHIEEVRCQIGKPLQCVAFRLFFLRSLHTTPLRLHNILTKDKDHTSLISIQTPLHLRGGRIRRVKIRPQCGTARSVWIPKGKFHSECSWGETQTGNNVIRWQYKSLYVCHSGGGNSDVTYTTAELMSDAVPLSSSALHWVYLTVHF